MPKPRGPASASPESLRTTRLNMLLRVSHRRRKIHLASMRGYGEARGTSGPRASRLLFCRLASLLGCLLHRSGLRHGPVGRAHLEAGKAPHSDVLAQLGHFLSDKLFDAHRLVLDEGLLQQANLFVELGHFAFHDALD